jgi:hypothetical protein
MAMQGHYAEHWCDLDGNPAGGVSTGKGFTISWQHGPLGRVGSPESREPNGAFVEDVIQAVIGRLAFYQDSRFACQANADALEALLIAADVLDQRTKDREARLVEGTHMT